VARVKRAAVLLLALALASCHAPAPTTRASRGADPELLAAIEVMPAIDDHAHPGKLVGDGEKDDEWDQLTYDGMQPFRLGAQLEDDATWIRAAKAMFAYPYEDLTPERFGWIASAKQKMVAERGDAYPSWVLDRLHLETMIANRVALGRGLAAPRFRWVPYVDALIFPLDNAGMAVLDPDRATFFPGINRGAERFRRDAGVDHLPPSLDAYVEKVVVPTLERAKQGGAVAIKFEAAYLRSLSFADPSDAAAREVYEKYAAGGVPGFDEYKTLQDWLFRRIAREAGRLALPVHIHCAWGPGRYFRFAETGPLALEPVFDDPALKDVKFVVLHGGWPAVHDMTALLAKPNVWADFSWQPLITSPRALSATLREWLELMPEKVLFGTDTFPSPMGLWELSAWTSSTNARLALAMALTDMMNDGEITRARALELARMVLHDNAAALYGWSAAASAPNK
jgi:predicted TIM-barrel fold metal-dependent hydrolase